MKVGLFFGTFNPIHNGHLSIAGFMANKTDLDEVWLVVSPQNPLKQNEDLLEDKARYELVKIAIKKQLKLKADDTEFHLPKPSYTIDTLFFLKKNHPDKSFVLIIGEDNLRNFRLWKEYEKILSGFELYVYPRKVLENEKKEADSPVIHPHVRKFDLQLLDISATTIRNSIRNGKDVSELLPEEVWSEIKMRGYYQ